MVFLGVWSTRRARRAAERLAEEFHQMLRIVQTEG